MPLLKDENVAVPVVAAEIAAAGGGPLADAVVDLGQKGGFRRLVEVFDELVVVVQHDDADDGPGSGVLRGYVLVLRHVHEVAHAPVGSGDGAALQGEDVPVDPVLLLPDDRRLRCLPMALRQPLEAEAGDHVRHGDLKDVDPLPGGGQEFLVGPEHGPVPQVEDHQREGDAQDGVGVHVVPLTDRGPHVFQDLVLLPAVDKAGVEEEEQAHQQFDNSQLPVAQQHGRQGENHQHGKIQPHGRPEKPGENGIAMGLFT